MQQPSAIKVNWSDKLLIPRVVDNWEKSRVIFRKQANFIPLFPPCMDADNSIWKGNTVRTWFSSPGQDPWRKKTKPFYLHKAEGQWQVWLSRTVTLEYSFSTAGKPSLTRKHYTNSWLQNISYFHNKNRYFT